MLIEICSTEIILYMKAIVAVMNITWAVVIIRPEKKFKPVLRSVHYCEDRFNIHVFNRCSYMIFIYGISQTFEIILAQ